MIIVSTGKERRQTAGLRITPLVLIAQLEQHGILKDDAAYLARFAGAIARGEFKTDKSDVQQLLGRSATGLPDFLKEIYSK